MVNKKWQQRNISSNNGYCTMGVIKEACIENQCSGVRITVSTQTVILLFKIFNLNFFALQKIFGENIFNT